MKKRNYWLERASKFVDYFVNAAEKIADKLGNLYFSASRKIEAETAKVFKAFERAFELSETEAKTLLAKTDGKTPSKAVIEAVNKITDPDLKRQAEAAISAPAYQYRMKRLDEIAKNGKKVCEELAQVETKTDTNFLKDQADKAHKRSVFDLQKGTGVSGSFTQVPKSHIEQMIKTNWSGRHYSERIWGNTQQLADELKDTLAEGFLTGASEQKMVKRIRERFQVGAFEARRLIRTESTYITEQAKLETYKAIHAEKYEYSALLDSRTSKICRKLDGKKFKVSEAQAGKNYPPMHPFCRSTTFSVLPSEEELEKEWKKETADIIPENMEFEEWLDRLEETEDGKLAFKAEKTVDILGESGIIEIGKSLSAATKNYPVKLIDSRQHTKLAENQKIIGKVFAGKGTNREIRDKFRLESFYKIPADEWVKMSGKGRIIVNGKERYAELHWYEAEGTIVEMKVKRFLDES